MSNALQWKMSSKIGPLYLVASEVGLCGVFWNKQRAPLAKALKGNSSAEKILSQTIMQLEEYLEGKRKKFNLHYDIKGTAFQKAVWNELRKIPYGETVAYQDIARQINRPKATRAVGTANGKNPLSIIVPCHRVIAASGGMGGYAGGLKIKSTLLKLENRES